MRAGDDKPPSLLNGIESPMCSSQLSLALFLDASPISVQPQFLTRRQGLSVWAPMRLKPLPGTYWPPTAKAMMVEEFLVRKYWGEAGA